MCGGRREVFTEDNPEADEVDSLVGTHHEAAGSFGHFGVVIPTAAFKHFELAGDGAERILHVFFGKSREPVVAPFPDVSMHIVKAPGVWFLLADGVGGAVAILESPGEFIREGGIAKAEEVRVCG